MDLRQYISDNVLRFLGASDSATVDFIQTLATSAKNPSELYHSLSANGLPNTSEAQAFVTQLHSLAPHKHKTKAAKAEKARERNPLLSNQKYALIMGDEEMDDEAGSERKKKKSKKDKGKEVIKGEVEDRSSKKASGSSSRAIRKRETDGKEWESDEDEKRRERKRMREMSPEDDDRYGRYEERGVKEEAPVEEETEEERLAREEEEDKKERDAFAERMKERDKDSTKKIVVDKSSKGGAAAEAAARRQLADDGDARRAAMPDLRQHSRQEYLRKRELQQIDLLKLEIQDEAILFRGQKMTKRETAEHEKKKALLRIMEERQKIDDGKDGYQLPEDYITEQGKIDTKRKNNVLYQRYDDNKGQSSEQFVTDVDQWEASQTDNSSFKTGALDKIVIEEEYDYVFDESQQIKWVTDGALEGQLNEKDAALAAQVEELEKKCECVFAVSIVPIKGIAS